MLIIKSGISLDRRSLNRGSTVLSTLNRIYNVHVTYNGGSSTGIYKKIIKNWIIVSCNFRDLIGLAAMLKK